MTRIAGADQTRIPEDVMKKWIALAVALAACNSARVVDLSPQEDAMPRTTSAAEPGPPEGGPAVPATCGYHAGPATCSYAGTCSDGSGYLADPPSTCQDPVGAQMAFTSTSEVAAALVGTWSECGQGVSVDDFVGTISQDATAIQFDASGHFALLAMSARSVQDLSLVPGTSAADKGTFEILDASATLGPDTYQVRLTASDGGVHTTQVVAFSGEPRLRFFAPGASDYVHAPTKQFQANVCGPPFGNVDTPSDGTEALARLQGRWARCPNPGTGSLFDPIQGMGLEFPGDGTWYALVEDSSGALVRSKAPLSQGTVEVAGSSPPQLKVIQGTAQYTVLSPILGECGTLGWAQSEGVLGDFEADVGTTFFSYQYMRLP
jgi:hypothetical protein